MPPVPPLRIRPVPPPLALALALLLALGLGGCGGLSATDPGVTLATGGGPGGGDTPAAFTAFADYRLQPGDILELQVSPAIGTSDRPYVFAVNDQVAVRFPDLPRLNETQPVRSDGRITLAYVGEVAIAGRTIEAVTQDLRRRYARILRNPEIYVTLDQPSAAVAALTTLAAGRDGEGRLVRVRPDGGTTFPLLGEMAAAGRTLPDLGSEVTTRYAALVPGADARITLNEHGDQLVYVLGQVNAAGAYPVTRPVTMLEALSLAGGFTTEAKLSAVVLIRREGRTLHARAADVDRALGGKTDASVPMVLSGDVVYVPRGTLATLSQLMTNLSNVIQFRGWSLGFGWALDDTLRVNRP